MERHITLAGIEALPNEMVELFLLELEPATLKELCSSSSQLHSICSDPVFRKEYKQRHKFHTELKHLFTLYVSGHGRKCPVEKYYKKYVEKGIPANVATKMAAEKLLRKVKVSPKLFVDAINECWAYDDDIQAEINEQEKRVTQAARKTPSVVGADVWLDNVPLPGELDEIYKEMLPRLLREHKHGQWALITPKKKLYVIEKQRDAYDLQHKIGGRHSILRHIGVETPEILPLEY